jgi:hypothetical protein
MKRISKALGVWLCLAIYLAVVGLAQVSQAGSEGMVIGNGDFVATPIAATTAADPQSLDKSYGYFAAGLAAGLLVAALIASSSSSSSSCCGHMELAPLNINEITHDIP